MKIKITISAVWEVHPFDHKTAMELLKNQPLDTAQDYLNDAGAGSHEISTPVAKWEEVK